MTLPQLMSMALVTLTGYQAHAQYDAPRMIFHARFWQTIPGWTPSSVDAAYIEFTPAGDAAADAEAIRTGELGQAPAGQRMFGTNSIKHSREILTHLKAKGFMVDYLGYDLEQRPQTPAEEQEDPLAACLEARDVANEFGIPLMIVPTAELAQQWGPELAPYADYFQPQGKAYQAYDTALAVQRQRTIYRLLRDANPRLRFFHDMAMVPKGKELALEDLLDYYYGCSDMVEGLSIWATPAHRAALTQFVLTVRPPEEPPPGVRSPLILSGPDASKSSFLVHERVLFKVVAKDHEGDPLVYTWDFGDHAQFGDGCVLMRGPDVEYAYNRPGMFTVRVTVTDGRGGAARASLQVIVRFDPPTARPPVND